MCTQTRCLLRQERELCIYKHDACECKDVGQETKHDACECKDVGQETKHDACEDDAIVIFRSMCYNLIINHLRSVI